MKHGHLYVFIGACVVTLALFSPHPAQATVPTWDVALSGPIPELIDPTSIGIGSLIKAPGWFDKKEHGITDVAFTDALALLIPSWDSVAWWAADLLLDLMRVQVINWINSGFDDGSLPFFLQDPEKFLTELGDQASGVFIEDLGAQFGLDPNFFCSNFLPEIVLDLQLGGRGSYFGDFGRGRCTITDVVSNIEDYYDDFENGSWDAFFRTRESRNNRVGFYLETLREHDQRRWEAEEFFRRQEQHSGGYLGNVDCVPGEKTEYNKWCRKFSIRTPSKAIADRVTTMIGVDFGRVANSDEISEIIADFINAGIKLALDSFLTDQ